VGPGQRRKLSLPHRVEFCKGRPARAAFIIIDHEKQPIPGARVKIRGKFAWMTAAKSGNSPLEPALPGTLPLPHQNQTQTLKPNAMKTTKIISALSLVLIFAASSMFAGNGINGGNASQKKAVTYEVRVNISPSLPGANDSYLIAITDENGHRVVPAQNFPQGVYTYTFKEAAGDFKGTRIAILIPYPPTQMKWAATPSVIKGFFSAGSTYRFLLEPKAGTSVETAGN
jgi:hypothetical protein